MDETTSPTDRPHTRRCCLSESVPQGVWRCSVCDRRYRTRAAIPVRLARPQQSRVVVSEPMSKIRPFPLHNDTRRAVIAELLIALHQQGYRVVTAAQIERASRHHADWLNGISSKSWTAAIGPSWAVVHSLACDRALMRGAR